MRANQLTCNNVNLQQTVDSLTAENKFLTERLQTVYHDYETFLDRAVAHSSQAINSFNNFIADCQDRKRWIHGGIEQDALK